VNQIVSPRKIVQLGRPSRRFTDMQLTEAVAPRHFSNTNSTFDSSLQPAALLHSLRASLLGLAVPGSAGTWFRTGVESDVSPPAEPVLPHMPCGPPEGVLNRRRCKLESDQLLIFFGSTGRRQRSPMLQANAIRHSHISSESNRWQSILTACLP
jgi:hypothetical protein